MFTSLNPNRLRSLLRFVAIGCWVIAILVTGWAVWPTPETQLASPPTTQLPFQVVTSKTASKPTAAPDPVSLGIHLLGTVTEDQNRIAIASDRSGRIVFHKEGEELDLQPAGIRIEEIAADEILVRYQDKIHSIILGDYDEDDRYDAPAPTILDADEFPKMDLDAELDMLNGS